MVGRNGRSGLKLAAAAIALAAILAAPTAIASSGGGGGGGGSPSFSGPTIDPVARYQDGVKALQANDFKKAENAFRDVLDAAPKEPNTNYLLARAKIGRGDVKGAQKYLAFAVKYKADFVEARGWLGAVATRNGDAAAATEQKTALTQMKTACDAKCPNAALIDDALTRIDRAGADPAAQLSSADPSQLRGYGAPEAGDAAYLTASGLINDGRYEDALVSLAESARAFGPHPDILTYEGFANRKLGRRAEAVAFYGQALAIDPRHRGANEYLGEYYVEIGDLRKARSQLAKLEGICAFGCEQAEELRRWIDRAS